ncbi:hypothetical protein ABPG74_012977, partial [Tetrahymena malaccensis]
TDFYGCLFLITPKYETKMLTQMNKQNIQDDYSQINQKNFDLLVRELETNDMIFQKNKGKSISYGEEFQLLHFKSRKFLSINQDSQSGELQNNYTLRLAEISNEKTLFKVGAAFKHQSDSSKVVKFEDLIHFCCCPDREAYVYYVKKKEKSSFGKPMILKSQIDMNQSQDFTKSVNNQSYSDISSVYNEQLTDDHKYQFYVGYDKKCYFKLKYFSELEQDTNQIFFGDIFCINSYENSTFLQCLVTTKLSEPQRQPKIIAEKTQLIHNQNLKDDLKVERHKNNNAILFFQEQNNIDYNSSLSLWKIEGKELHTGGFIYEGDLFRLKNIKTNMYLMVKSKEQIISQELKKGLLERTKNIDYIEKKQENYPQNLVYLVSHIFQPSIYEQSGKDIFLIDQNQNEGTVTFQYTDEDTLFTFEKEVESGEDLGLEQLLRQKYFTIVIQNFFFYEIQKIQLKKKMKPSVEKREVFKLYKSQHQEIWETTFMLSCIPVIRKRTSDLKNLKSYIQHNTHTYDKQFDKYKQKIKNLNLCLKMLHEFCYDENERMQDMQLDVLSLEIGLVNTKRQKLLKQYDLITDCARIIQEIDKTFYPKDVQNNIEEIQETLILIYQFFIKASFNNPDNQLECAKYFPLMVDHIGLNVESEKCIRYILADNIKLLQSVDQPLVKSRCFLGDEQEGQKQYTEFNRIIDDLISSSKNQFQQNQTSNFYQDLSPYTKKQSFTLSQHFLKKFDKTSTKEINKSQKYDKIQQNEEILHYFNSIIKYNSVGLTYNQTEVAKIIIEEISNQTMNEVENQFKQYIQHQKQIYDLILNFFKKSQKLYAIRSTTHNQLTFKINGNYQEFQEYLIENDDNKQYRKCLQIQLKLYANLCYGRNYECINKVKEIISFKALQNYIKMFEEKIKKNQGDIDVLDNFSSSLYSIIYCTYLDKYPYIERKVPKLIHNRNISDIQHRSYDNTKERNHQAQHDNYQLSKQQSQEQQINNYINLDDRQNSIDKVQSANNSPELLLNINQQNENQYNQEISFNNSNNSFQQKRQSSLQRSLSQQSSEKLQIDQLKEDQVKWLIENVKDFLKNLNGKQNRRANLIVKVVRLIQKLYSFESIKDQNVQTEIFEALILLFKSQINLKKQNKVNSEEQSNLESSQNQERRSKVLSEYSAKEILQNEKSEKAKKIVKKIPKIQDDQLLFYSQIKNLNEFIRLIDEEKSKDAKVKEEIKYNIQTKITIMQIFKQYIDLRRENYLQSIIKFITRILPDMQQSDERKIKEKLENEIDILMPSVNLPDQPLELKEKEDTNLLNITTKFASGLVSGLTNNLKDVVGMGSEQKAYVLEEDERPSKKSLDSFLQKDNENKKNEKDKDKEKEKDEKSSQQFIWMLLNTFLNSTDYKLNCSILKILFFNFSQCRNLIRSVKQCQIIIDRIDRNEERIAQDLEERIKDFNIQCEKSETWFIDVNNKQNSETMKKVSDKLKDLNYMFFCKKLIKDQEDKLIYEEQDQKPENIQMSRQFMIRNLDAHNSVITLIKDSLKIFKSFKEFNSEIEQQVIYIKCFNFLKYFCIGGNKLNKKLLYNQIDFFMDLLNYLELGQTDLIIEIYKDNYKAITEVNDATINAVLKKIMQYDEEKELKISQGHLPKYVDFFYHICIFKQVPVQQNIHKIILALQDLANLQDFLFMENVGMKNHARNQLKQNQLQNDQKQKEEYQFCFDKISVEQYGNNNIPYVYHSKVLELILLLLENSDQGAKYFVQKLKNLLPAKYLIKEMAKKGDIFCSQDFPQFFCYTQIKRYCFKLFNIFYCNQEGLKEIQDMIKDMQNMNQFIYVELFKVSEALYRYFNIPESKLQVINFKKREKNSNISNFDIDSILGENIIEKKDIIDKVQEAKQKEYNQLLLLLVQQYPYLKEASSKEKKYVKLSDYLNHLLNEVWPVISFLFKQIEEYKQAMEQSSQKEDFEQFKPYTQFKDWFLESVAKLLIQSYNSCKNNEKVAADIQREVIIDEEVAGDFNRQIKSYLKDLGKSYEDIEIQQIFFAVKPKERLILNYQNQINYPSVETIINLPLQNILSSKNNNDQFVRKCLLNILINPKIKEKIVDERQKLIYCIQSIQNITDNNEQLSLEFLLQKIIQYIPQCFQEFVKGHNKEDHSVLIDILRFLHDFILYSKEDQEVDQDNKNKINFNEDDEDTVKNLKIQQETLGISDLGDQKQDTRSRKNANDFSRRKHQNLMAKFNLPYILLETLCSDSNKVDYFQNHLCRKIFNSIIMLFIQLLDGGNLIIQEQLYQFFIKEENSEKFFEIIHQFLTIKIQNRSSQKTTIFDQVEYELDHIDLVYRSKDKFVGILEILKLLQLICENHNSNLQNYIRHQTKSRNNYNLIQDVIQVIDSQIRVLNKDNIKIININQQNIEVLCQAFETLTEFVQGPCKQNQLELAESPIIEIIAGILDLGLEKEKMGRGRRSTDIRNSQRHSSFNQLNNNQKQSQKYIYDENELKEQTQLKIINYLKQEVQSEYFKNLIQKKFNEANKQEDWMIQKAKYKSLITIESILEGNKVKKIVKKIEKGINTKLLNLNMLNTYNKFKVSKQKEITYTEDLFGRGDIEIEDIISQSEETDKKDLRQHCDKIIEIGFKCLILKNYYNNLADESNYDKEENDREKKDANDEDDEDEDLEDQDYEDLMDDDDDEDESQNYYALKVENNDNQAQVNNGILKNKQPNSNEVQINYDDLHSNKQNQEKYNIEQPQQDYIDLYYENTEINKRPDQVFFQKYLVELEINYQGQLSKVYFPKPPIANSLNQALIKRFEFDAQRQSTKAKVLDLQQKSQLLISEMKYEYQFNNFLLMIIPKNQFLIKLLNFLLKNKQKNKKNDNEFENEKNEEQLNVDLLETFNFWSFIFTIISNLCIILVLEENHSMTAQNIGNFLYNNYQFDEEPYVKIFISFKQSDFIIVFYFFSILAIIFQGLAFFIYWYKNHSFLLSEYVFNNQKIVKQKQRELKSKQEKLDEENEQQKLKIYRHYQNILFYFENKLMFQVNYEFKYWLYSNYPRIIPLFSYQFLQLSITILSIINPIPCALMLLLYIFSRYPELKNILQAIYKPRKQILLTLALLCLSTYFFSLLYYYNFYRDFDPYCVSIWKCFTFILVQTFVAEGGFLGVIFPDYTDNWGFSFRIIADFAYVFFINILVTQILSGTIIDQFAQLREETQKRQEDINTVCFICGQNVSELEKRKNKKGQSFRDHIELEHSKWNYINFMQYLDSKKETDLSGFESFVNHKRQNHDISWFPIRQDEEEDNKRQEGDDINFENIEQQIQLKKKKELGGLEQNWQLVGIKIEDINNRIIQVENELKKKTIKKKDD